MRLRFYTALLDLAVVLNCLTERAWLACWLRLERARGAEDWREDLMQ